MKNKILVVLTLVLLLNVFGCSKEDQDVSDKEVKNTVVDNSDKEDETQKETVIQTNVKSEDEYRKEILSKDITYSNYDVKTVSNDFNSDGTNEYFFVFTDKTATDESGIFVDIWYASNVGIEKIVDSQFILPDTFTSLDLGGKKYFRYDLSYATESCTVLLSVENGKCVESFAPSGEANFMENSNEFTVMVSPIDLSYDKTLKSELGRTSKTYYFYAGSDGINEYGATEISEEKFLQYSNADSILNEIEQENSNQVGVVSYQFLKRTNGLVHINISRETDNEIIYSYKTYKVGESNNLSLDNSGEGKYLPALCEGIATY